MANPQQRDDVSVDRPVLVSNTAANMVSSLHPFDKSEADAVMTAIKSSVLDPTRVTEIPGVENAFVARADELSVIFKEEGDAIVITSVLFQN